MGCAVPLKEVNFRHRNLQAQKAVLKRNREKGQEASRNQVALPGVLAPIPHQCLVFANTKPLPFHNAGAFGAGLVLVIGILLQMLAAEPCLLFIIRLLLLIGHGFPSGSYKNREQWKRMISITFFILPLLLGPSQSHATPEYTVPNKWA